MKKRVLCWLLVLVMVVSLLPTFAAAAEPVDYGANGVITNPDPAQDATQELNLTKVLTPGANGTYDITMTSWATGEVKAVTEKIPTDFVIVVDQSGSMNTKDMVVGGSDSFTQPASTTLEDAATGNYYVYDEANGVYYRVYGKHGYRYYKYPANTYYVDDLYNKVELMRWFDDETQVAEGAKGYYYLDGDIFYPVTITVEGKFLNYECYLFYYKNGTKTYLRCKHSRPTGWQDYHSWRCVEVPGTSLYDRLDSFSNKIQHDIYKRHAGYTGLYYRDMDGVEHAVTTSVGNLTDTHWCTQDGSQSVTSVNGSQRMVYNNLYKLKDGDQYTQTRLQALNNALGEFVQAVANEKDSFGAVDNKISIIGFSSDGFNNNELLTNTTEGFSVEATDWTNYSGSSHYSLDGSAHDGIQKSQADANPDYYAKALVSATDNNTVGTVNPAVTAAIDGITAHGGTQPERGLDMAYQVLENRGDTKYTIRSGDHKDDEVERNTVVIFFTDGQPGDNEISNQYLEADDVVESAARIKALDSKPTIFTIGVFGESDGNPLTYSDANATSINADWAYVSGFVKTIPYGSSYHCLRRQWRPNNAVGYTENANDTIFDYMSVISSNYPSAQTFINRDWVNGTKDAQGNYVFTGNYIAATEGVRGTYVGSNQYYRMASNQDTLVSAFLEAVTMTNDETSSGVTLNTTAIFKDAVNLADFDVSGATYTVQWEPVKLSGGEPVNNGTIETKVNGAAVPADGKIEYSGFDYSANYVSAKKNGMRLIVTINGLVPKKTVGELKSNNGNAGVYGKDEQDPTVQITSPTLQFSDSAAKTYVIDFNAKMTVATEATKLVGATNDTVTGTNGSFVKSGTNVTYQLISGNQASKTAEINKAYTGVDTAMVYGKLVNVENAQIGWNQITTVPASSVYYDDDLAKDTTPAVNVGDGSGYNAGLADQIGTAASQSAQTADGTYYFTFYGTGIDVYCTTHESAGYVTLSLFVGDKDHVDVNNRADKTLGANYQPKAIKNYSSQDYYNTPTVTYTGMPANTYTLKIVCNGSSTGFKLDGVRVYNPVQANSTAATELNKTDEANATYLNLRKVLLNDSGIGGFTVNNEIEEYQKDENGEYVLDENGQKIPVEIDPEAVSGVLFIDNYAAVKTMSNHDENGEPTEEPVAIYTSQFDVYQNNGPKNEIYLDANQALTFQLNTSKFDENTKVYIGLSAPNNTSPVVKINGVAVEPAVTTVMDMYYPVNFNLKNADNNALSITVSNDGPGVVSITNLKITGIPNLIPAATQSNEREVLHATRALFAPVTMKTVRMAANNGVDPEAPVIVPDTPDTPDTPSEPDDSKPSWNDGMDTVQAILKQLFQMLLQSLNGLFSGLGNW